MEKKWVLTVNREAQRMDILVFVAIVATWFLLQAWILPKFGVQT